MEKYLQKAADKLIKQGESDLECFITDEEGLMILQYIFDKTGITYGLTVNEEDDGDDLSYNCSIYENDEMVVEFEYWANYTR